MASTVQWLAVIGVALAASAWDLRTRRIPNWLTFGAAAFGVLSSTFDAGLAGFTHGVIGWVAGLVLFLPLFLLGGMGAGDVKLLAAFGAILGVTGVLWTAILASLLGGALAVVVGAMHGYLGEAVRNLAILLTTWRIAGVSPISGMTLTDARGPRLAYAVPIAVGALLALWLGHV